MPLSKADAMNRAEVIFRSMTHLPVNTDSVKKMIAQGLQTGFVLGQKEKNDDDRTTGNQGDVVRGEG